MPSKFSLNDIFYNRPQDHYKKIALIFWILVTLFCAIQSLISHRFNNYLIFENTFRNLIHQQSFYLPYPTYHFDSNHYGPIFSVFIMPFAILPHWLGLLLWDFFNCMVLFKAIESIPIKNHAPLYLIATPCYISASLSEQFNPASAAFIILSYTLLNKNKGLWSTMLIVLGTFIKLYGIVGLAFFFFVKYKKRFMAYLTLWATIFLLVPMLFSSPEFIFVSYKEWVISLIYKNANNIAGASTDISIMGFIRSLFPLHHISNSIFLTFGIALFGLPYLNVKAYKMKTFQLYILGSVLLFPVLFSSGSEDCTYIIAVSGIGIWYVFAEKTALRNFLFVMIFIFSCNFPLLLFPDFASTYPILLRMLSFPFFVIWLLIIYKASLLKKRKNYVLKWLPN